MKRSSDIIARTDRIREKMRRWGIPVSFLAGQLAVTRQYAWQIVHYRTPLSTDRAEEIERVVDTIIAERQHAQSFGERLRAARIASGMTLKEVAEKIGYSWVGVERWERDVCLPKPGVLWHLFSLYGNHSHFGLTASPVPGHARAARSYLNRRNADVEV
jgi:DNA-binding XRE family transcriptional regulator